MHSAITWRRHKALHRAFLGLGILLAAAAASGRGTLRTRRFAGGRCATRAGTSSKTRTGWSAAGASAKAGTGAWRTRSSGSAWPGITARRGAGGVLGPRTARVLAANARSASRCALRIAAWSAGGPAVVNRPATLNARSRSGIRRRRGRGDHWGRLVNRTGAGLRHHHAPGGKRRGGRCNMRVPSCALRGLLRRGELLRRGGGSRRCGGSCGRCGHGSGGSRGFLRRRSRGGSGSRRGGNQGRLGGWLSGRDLRSCSSRDCRNRRHGNFRRRGDGGGRNPFWSCNGRRGRLNRGSGNRLGRRLDGGSRFAGALRLFADHRGRNGRRLDHHCHRGRRNGDGRALRNHCACRSLGDHRIDRRMGGNSGRRRRRNRNNGRRGARLRNDPARLRTGRRGGGNGRSRRRRLHR